MNKFKVGDWVKIVNPSWVNDKENIRFKNKIVKITNKESEGFYNFVDLETGELHSLYEEEIILLKPKLKKFLQEFKRQSHPQKPE